MSLISSRSFIKTCPFAYDDDNNSELTTGTSSSRLSTARLGSCKSNNIKKYSLIDEEKTDYINSLMSIRIENIPEKIPQNILQKEFEKFGEIIEFKILINKNGRNRGIGFIKYKNEEDALNAIKIMNNTFLNIENYPNIYTPEEKRKLIVKIAEQQCFFSNNTGALGITNKPIGEIVEKKDYMLEQHVN